MEIKEKYDIDIFGKNLTFDLRFDNENLLNIKSYP